MKKNLLLTLFTALTLAACAESKGEAGDACSSDGDCADGLHCHIEGHDDDADADADADEDDHADEGHDDDHDDETGICEEEEDGHEGHDH